MTDATTEPDVGEPPPGPGPPPSSGLLPLLVAMAALLVVPVLVGDSRTYMGVALGIVVAIGYAIGFNVVFGLTGQLFLCVGALGGVGGYGTAILADDVGVPVPVALLAAVAATATLGAAFSWVSVRRSLDVIFTGIVTLTFGLAFENLVLARRDLTGGEDGRRVEAAADTVLDDQVWGYYALAAVVCGLLVVFRSLEQSHHGWAYRALRDDAVTAALAGVDVARHRVRAGAAGAAMIGLVGGMVALVEGRIAPDVFRFTEVDVESLVIVAAGGIGQLLAPVVGGLLLGLLDELLLRHLGTLRIAVFGGVLLLLFLVLRDGVIGTTRRRAARRRRLSVADGSDGRVRDP